MRRTTPFPASMAAWLSPALVGAWFFLLGCQPPPPSAIDPADAAPPQNEPPASTEQAARPAPAPRASAEGDAPTRPSRLELSADPHFLAAPLPGPVPDRYQSWREVGRIEVGQSHLMEVDRLPSGGLVALSQAEGKVRVYAAEGRRLIARHDVAGWGEFEPTALLAFPGAPDRYVLGTRRGLGIFDAASGALLSEATVGPVWKLRWSADKRMLMALSTGQDSSAQDSSAQGSSAQGSLLRFFARGDGSELRQLGELAFDERVDAFDLSPDARLLAVAHYPSGVFRILDLGQGGREIHRAPAPGYAGDIAFSPDGRFLAVAGDGLLLVDLVNPARVAFYSYVKNNMGHVRFSPSSDAVVASSYDGKIRIFGFGSEPTGALGLALVKELSHAGQANVYAFVFSADGNELVSASGDRTLRVFAGRPKAPQVPAGAPVATVFRDLATWKKLDPEAARPLPTPPESSQLPSGGAGHARARPARIQPGVYDCKITLIYKLRRCWVHLDGDGRTRLEFAADNLLHLAGVLWDDGPAVRFEGKLLTPSTLIDCPGCEKEPLHAVFRGQNGKYTGLLTFRKYHDPHVPAPMPPLDVKIEEANDRYPLVLQYVGPLDSTSSGKVGSGKTGSGKVGSGKAGSGAPGSDATSGGRP